MVLQSRRESERKRRGDSLRRREWMSSGLNRRGLASYECPKRVLRSFESRRNLFEADEVLKRQEAASAA